MRDFLGVLQHAGLYELQALMMNRFGTNGFYILDEPESALSPHRQLAMLVRLHQLSNSNSQFLIATHSPILMAYPESWIYQISENNEIRQVKYEETEHYIVTRSFLNNTKQELDLLLR